MTSPSKSFALDSILGVSIVGIICYQVGLYRWLPFIILSAFLLVVLYHLIMNARDSR